MDASKPVIEVTQQFTFDAAHYLGDAPADSNRRIHGHSFYADVTLCGDADPATGWVRDFAEIGAVLDEIRACLDHRLLNDLAGLGAPTLENLARYIFRAAKRRLPEVSRVKLERPSLGQSCTYEET
ncbi:MAG TPA: 6-carboxytetrahydropterin synthase [Micropepsaceae bacterium]|nr:6-carboxytetrahydropterin synthase [Micropepsaceae bacterium]